MRNRKGELVSNSSRTIGAWQLIRESDPPTDEESSYIRSPAYDYSSGVERGAVLMCGSTDEAYENGVEVFFYAARRLEEEEIPYTHPPITFSKYIYRIDGADPVTQFGSVSDSGTAVLLHPKSAALFLAEI